MRNEVAARACWRIKKFQAARRMWGGGLIAAGAGLRSDRTGADAGATNLQVHVNRRFMRGILSIANARDEHHGTNFGQNPRSVAVAGPPGSQLSEADGCH